MVGVPKSKGCATCRQRKIRCDETWPVCQRCQQSSRTCPGPSLLHGKFLDEGPKQWARQALPPPNNCAALSARLDQNPCKDIEIVRTRDTGRGKFSVMKIVKEDEEQDDEAPGLKHNGNSTLAIKRASNRRSRSRSSSSSASSASSTSSASIMNLAHLSMSGLDKLIFQLVATLNEQTPANQMKLFGPFIGEVPKRLGSTTALDSAAACLISTHANIMRKSETKRMEPRLYDKAITSLRLAVENPQTRQSTQTLCAMLLMAITEAYAVGTCGTNHNFIAHLGGAAELLRMRGPNAFKDPQSFERGILRAVTVGIGLDALFSDKDDILTDPEWHDIAFDTTDLVEPRYSMNRISRAMAHLPSLTRAIRAYIADPLAGSPYMPAELYARAEELKEMLNEAKPFIDSLLEDDTSVWSVPSTEIDPPFPVNLAFKDPGTAFALWFYWAMAIIIDCIIISLHRRQSTAPYLPSRKEYVDHLEKTCKSMARMMCMSWEYAKACRPLGAMYVDVGLMLAYNVFTAYDGGDTCQYRQEWILEALTDLSEGVFAAKDAGAVGNPIEWTIEPVEWVGAWLTAGAIGRIAVDNRDGRRDGKLKGKLEVDNDGKMWLVLPPNGLRIPWSAPETAGGMASCW